MDVPALGAQAAKLREGARRQQPEPDEPVKAVTAFLVYITADGRYIMDSDLNVPLTTERPPTRHEIIAACTCVGTDIKRQSQTEELTMNVLGNFARMQSDPQFHLMAAQARAQAEAAAAAASAK